MSAPKVSVSIICYNQEHYIGPCLESVLRQQVDFPFDIVIGDDASTDSTRTVIETYRLRYPDRIRLIVQSRNTGGTKNYYDVAAACRGEYIAHLDGDDMMLPGKLARQAAFLDTHPECSMVLHQVALIRETDPRWLGKYPATGHPRIADLSYLVETGSFAAHSSKMYRRSANRFPSRSAPTLDLLLNFEHATCGFVGYLDETLGIYRLVSGTLNDPVAQGFERTVRCTLEAYERALELQVPETVVKRGLSRYKAGIALNYLAHGDLEQFQRWLGDSVSSGAFLDWRHRVLHELSRFPRLTRLIYTLYRKMAGMGPLNRAADRTLTTS